MMEKGQLQDLKRSVGRRPFEERQKFVSGFCRCPFHDGDSDKSMHLFQGDSGEWLAKCFSTCNKSFDAISFVMEFDHVKFPEAVQKLQQMNGGSSVPRNQSGDMDNKVVSTKPNAKPLTVEQWQTWGRAITQADVDRFAKSRSDRTASLETFQRLDVRVRGDLLGFPYRLGESFYQVKLRHMDNKSFFLENNVSSGGLFNLDSVNPLEDVFIMEGEPDVLVMEEAGYRAVGASTAQQQKFEPAAIAKLSEATRIFVVGDQKTGADPADPGQELMDRIQKLLPVEKTYRIKFSEAHDVCGLAKIHGDGFANRIAELCEDTMVPWVTRNIQLVHQLPREAQKWIIDRLLPYAGVALLSGRQGSQKSLLAMLAAHAVSGRDTCLGRAVLDEIRGHGCPVLYLDRENPVSEVNKRRERLGIIGNLNFIYWGEWSREPIPDDPLDPRLVEFARAGGYIIFDSLQQWYGGANENDNTAMVELMNKFKRLARIGAGVLILHHDNKADRKTGKSQTRGGTAIVASTDHAIKMTKNPDTEVVELRAERFRMCAPWELDFKVDFSYQAPEWSHWREDARKERFYSFTVLRDQDMSESMEYAKQVAAQAKAEKDKAKHDAEASDRQMLLDAIKETPTISPHTLERRFGFWRQKLVRMLREAGYIYEDGGWAAIKKPTAEPPEELPF